MPPVVIDAGARTAVEPEGAPDTDRVIVCEIPDTKVVEIATVPDLAGARLKLVGLAEIEKSLLTVEAQPGNLNDPMRVCQLNEPLEVKYSFVYQNVQSSAGSTLILL